MIDESRWTHPVLLEYRKRIRAMLDDPECEGDLLALGIALLDYAVLRATRVKEWDHYAEQAWGPGKHGWRIRRVLQDDMRRYDALKDADATDPAARCGAPMMRRQGPCGQTGTVRGMLTDATTGRKQWVSACRRHRDWFDDRIRANRHAVSEVVEAVAPAANAGGVLARHMPEIDWPGMWVKLDPKWTPPPEADPEPVQVVPRLRLVLADEGTA